ncbi:15-hydroxyprostaglandin dehydrogenase [NAD(+)] [Erpetoichthys calabaricus]|uniref:15-hydroxyprostaglandin dehydrogenase [NAD(+)] n=1 Tax=Erpetoichthys calabaricus TaxID=27687 RepID=A0A8C4XDN5_ERPCA|nr:15-hydroxyprostaglandin dehydrogenase [NAD(+)] [Erpetoichthys calabaricus]
MALTGRIALVTGGAQGIGRAISEALLREGAKVALVDSNPEVARECRGRLEEAFGVGSSLFFECDVTDWAKLQEVFRKTVKHFGHLDIAINNAGINNEKDWQKTINVNLTSLIKGTYLALEHMSRENGKDGGVIINVSSMAAFMHSPHMPVYTATKYGVLGFTKAMAEASAVGNFGVRINVLCPAYVDTPLLQTIDEEDKMGRYFKYKEELRQSMHTYGILDPSLIADGMMMIIKDGSLNGAVMKITASKGIHFQNDEPMSA